MKSFDKTIQMYIFEGNPNGRIMCELSNWNGRVYKISRSELGEFSKRNDAENTGVYFLLGKTDSNVETLYVGEAEKIFTRIKQHLKDENYWNDCIVVISKDNLLNKAHVKFLEHQFYQLAIESNRTQMINSTIPTCSSISEYDIAMLSEFIENTKLLVNALGYKTFDSIKENLIQVQQKNDVFYIKAARGADAKGFIVADGFVVMKGSKIAYNTTTSMSLPLIKLRSELMSNGTIDLNYEFVKDYVFTSPSSAAAIVMGRNANGRTEWKLENQKSLKDVEENKVN